MNGILCLELGAWNLYFEVEFMSWYRKYRPQTVAALHITPVREAFERILAKGDFAHAYLLSGPKGTGKTSGARILAKVLNCEENKEAVGKILAGSSFKLQEPCNKCAACKSITDGSSLCVTEMDGASNRGIDDIRELTARVGLSPGDGLINVVIIDEVHMLTTEAFNALLKVLEEPPRHVVFILATTDAQKMPATVVSRCQVINYRKATSEEIVKALSQIASDQKIEVDVAVFEQLVAYADGSFRDGVKIFEQVAGGKQKVSLDDVVLILGKSVREICEQLLQVLGKRDRAGAVKLFSKFNADGTDLLMVQKELLKSLHERMITAPVASPHFATYIQLLKYLNLAPSMTLPIPGLPFEIACLEWCTKLSEVKPKLIPEIKLQPEIEIEIEPVVPVTAAAVEVEVEELPYDGPALEFSTVLDKWFQVLRGVREKNPSLEALLRTTKPQRVEDGQLWVEVFYKFHKEQLESARNFAIIEQVLKNEFGHKIKINFILGVKAEKAASSPESNLSGLVDTSFVKAAEDAFLS